VTLLVETSLASLEQNREKLSADACKRARHVLEEIDRVARATAALERGDLPEAGRLLVASHRSSQHQFENSTATLDTLVDALVKTPHVYGARLTGGGFGGAVMALTDAAFGAEEVAAVTAAYAKRHDGAKPDVLHCQTGDGAAVM
jgi:galactokinase